MSKTWFITGASRGFGREWAEAALERGDTVLPLQLDVTDRGAGFAAVERAAERFGKLDVVVNNAGYGHFGMIEELTESEVRAQLETNLLGALWITQAALPIMRAQGSGHIIQVSSLGGVTAFPAIGAYHASKWALEGLSQALAAEVTDFGIHITLIEPGGFSTDWAGPSARHSELNPAYDRARERATQWRAQRQATPGDPEATRDALLKVVDAEEPPLRIFFGTAPLEIATKDYESRLATWREWEPVSAQAQGD